MTDGEQWGSHLPALLAACEHTDGAIVECGIGNYSTPALHGFCEATGRRLYSLEHSGEWFDGLSAEFDAPWHWFMRVDDWDKPPAFTKPVGVVFVDHGKAPRGPMVTWAAHAAQIVVMHDSECHYCGYTEPLKAFDWVYTHKQSPAWTTLAGFGKPPEWLADLQPGEFGIPVPYRG